MAVAGAFAEGAIDSLSASDMTTVAQVAAAALVGVATTSSSYIGAAIGLYLSLSQRLLACILAFAAGSLISALAIDLGYRGALDLRDSGFSGQGAWAFVGGGFAFGASLYLAFTRFLEKRGAAVRSPTRFQAYAVRRKQQDTRSLIALLSRSELMRHLPASDIENILLALKTVEVPKSREVFHAGDPADALFIIAQGTIEIVSDAGVTLATLGEGQAFGEMALLAGSARSATARAATPAVLLELARADFELMLETDRQIATAAQHLSHTRALRNLTRGSDNPDRWARIASGALRSLSRGEVTALLKQAGDSAGIAIILGNILDTIPGCLVIGAKFHDASSLAITLILGMFVGGIPEAAASASILLRAGYRPRKVFVLWSSVLVAGLLAAAVGRLLIGDPHALTAIFCQAIAGGAVLALVAHAMIPEAIHEGGSLVVMPTVAGFLFALYASLAEAF
jgi:CRP-like cAMP-binding protein